MYGAQYQGPPGYYAQNQSFNAGMVPYGKTPFMQAGGGHRGGMNSIGACGSLWIPFIMFTVVLWMQSFSIRYNSPALLSTVMFCCFCLTVVFAYFAFLAYRRKVHGDSDPNWYLFLFLTSLIALCFAMGMGQFNYAHYMRPYYDVLDLNVYPAVDPMVSRGQQYMDGGRFVFTPSSRLDLSKSMGFKNVDTYCVAPLVSGNGSLAVYDFWAVGLNCCSGHTADYMCGEFSNPRAISGLRLMRDDQRSFFRLAVQQAEASYNIKSTHPIFFYLMSDPISEINAYQDGGFKYYIFAVFSFLALQFLWVVAATVVFSKGGYYQ